MKDRRREGTRRGLRAQGTNSSSKGMSAAILPLPGRMPQQILQRAPRTGRRQRPGILFRTSRTRSAPAANAARRASGRRRCHPHFGEAPGPWSTRPAGFPLGRRSAACRSRGPRTAGTRWRGGFAMTHQHSEISDSAGLDFEFEGCRFEYLGIETWRHASRSLPRFVLRFEVTCGRCFGSFSFSASKLTVKALRVRIGKHKCRPLPCAGEAEPAFDWGALELRIRDARFSRNVQVHGPIDPAWRQAVRQETARLYMEKEPHEIAAIRARHADRRARREVGA